MTTRHTAQKRLVYLDGYAGEGRYENGEAGSAEIALRVASHHRARHGLTLECYFAESDAKSFDRLESVVAHYRHQARAHAHHGEVDDVLDGVVSRAQGVPLFLFLDPCGLTLPQGRLVEVLALKRPEAKPPTELLMNFSMMAVWRMGGHVRSPKKNETSLRRFDEVCGGSWWREPFADAVAAADAEKAAKDAIKVVASEYGRRLGERTGMMVHSVPVRRAPTHTPIYQMVFATRSEYGLWVFGDAVARARNEWWRQVELREGQEGQLMLFSERPDSEEMERAAVPHIAANLERLLARIRRPFKLVDYTLEVFGDFYGQVTEPAARKAVRLLNEQGKTSSTGVGVRKTRHILVRPVADLAA